MRNDMTLVEMVTELRAKMEQIERVESALSDLRAEYDRLRFKMIPEACEQSGIENMSVAGVGRLTLTSDAWVSIKADSREAAYDWLEEHGMNDLIKPTVNSSSLRAAIKHRIRSGEEVPPDLFTVTPFTRASITRSST